MVNLLSLFTGQPGGIGTRPAPLPRPREEEARPRRSARAHLNLIPGDEELRLMISRALAMLAKGSYPDRGSIINLVL